MYTSLYFWFTSYSYTTVLTARVQYMLLVAKNSLKNINIPINVPSNINI